MADDDESLAVAVGEEEEESEPPEVMLKRIEEKGQQVGRLLAEARAEEALCVAVSDAPLDTRDQQCKAANWALVRRCLSSVKDYDSVCLNLPTPDVQDSLMRYLYKGLATGERLLCEKCLALHEKLTARAGVGCIMRVLADTKHTL